MNLYIIICRCDTDIEVPIALLSKSDAIEKRKKMISNFIENSYYDFDNIELNNPFDLNTIDTVYIENNSIYIEWYIFEVTVC